VLRRLLVVLVVAAVVLFGLDLGARLWAQSYVADQLQTSLGLSKPPSVRFGGVVFLPQLATGEVTSMSMEGRSFEAGEIEFERVRLDLRGVEYSPARLLLRRAGTIHAEEGDGSVDMTDRQLTDAFRARGIPVTVRFTEGAVKVSTESLPTQAKAAFAIEEGNLVLRPVEPALPVSFALDLPEFIPGMTYGELRFGEGRGRLGFDLRDVNFEVSAGE
jgi:LmeA-like phospholipid-binding